MSPLDPALLAAIQAPHPDSAPLPPGAVLDDGVRLLRGVPYAVPDGGRPLEADLWLPARAADDGAGPVPVVLFVHGGAWLRGRRDDMGLRTRDWRPGPFARIAATGCAVACVDYRLSGEARFPAPLEDLRTALRWLTVRSAELGIDTARTVAWGDSAGGHLASLLALTHREPPLAGAVVWYGPADLTAARGGFSPEAPATPEARLLGAAPASVPELARAASPLRQVHDQAPPFFLVHGARDVMVDRTHSEDLTAALHQAGASAELRLVPDADHAWYGAAPDDVEDLFTASLAFVHHQVS